MGGNGADLGRRQHLKIRNRMRTEPTRPETAMMMMRVVLSLTTAIPWAELAGYRPGSQREGGESRRAGVGVVWLKGVKIGMGRGVDRKADEAGEGAGYCWR